MFLMCFDHLFYECSVIRDLCCFMHEEVGWRELTCTKWQGHTERTSAWSEFARSQVFSQISGFSQICLQPSLISWTFFIFLPCPTLKPVLISVPFAIL